ncbi:hypothetical protein NCCP2050_16360 [Planococcus sp. NCCP-2050]|nr:hypothetical protein NCCP2050_16360 [Planococcus sp. NCCP-2050]
MAAREKFHFSATSLIGVFLLEIFKQAEIFQEDFKSFEIPKRVKHDWDILLQEECLDMWSQLINPP